MMRPQPDTRVCPTGQAVADDSSRPRSDTRRTVLRAGLLPAAVALAAPGRQAIAQAQGGDYPNRPVRFLVPFGPGSGTDTSARVYARMFTEYTGQPVVVDNRAGGNGFIAVQAVTSAPADGYTLFVGSNSTLATNVALFKKLPYDPARDFEPIQALVKNAVVLIAPPDSPYKTLRDLIAAGKAAPGKLTYAGGSAGYRLMAELFSQQVGIKMVYVPYKSAPESVTAVAAGQVDFSVVDISAALELARAGRVRMLAIGADKRSSIIPDVATSAEAGAPQFSAYTWVGAMAPVGTPRPVMDKLVEIFTRASQSKEVIDFYAQQGAAPAPAGPDYLRKFQREEIERWRQIATAAQVELQ